MAKMKLEVVIETEGQHCGNGCKVGTHIGMHEECMGEVCVYDFHAEKWTRTPLCKDKAVECPQ